MTYDTWKTTEPEHTIGFICDGCLKACDPHDMILRDDGPCYCRQCDEKMRSEPDDGC